MAFRDFRETGPSFPLSGEVRITVSYSRSLDAQVLKSNTLLGIPLTDWYLQRPFITVSAVLPVDCRGLVTFEQRGP